jgi:hypothetical protein
MNPDEDDMHAKVGEEANCRVNAETAIWSSF